MGQWGPHTGLSFSKTNLLERRSDFQGIPIIDIKLPYPPFIYETAEGHRQGLTVEIMSFLEAALNFKTVHMVPNDGVWDGKYDNGKGVKKPHCYFLASKRSP